jgi:hypothetical protein
MTLKAIPCKGKGLVNLACWLIRLGNLSPSEFFVIFLIFDEEELCLDMFHIFAA